MVKAIAIIDKKGLLSIDGKRGIVKQWCCLDREGTCRCGDWCPQFGVQQHEADDAKPGICLCFDRIRTFDEILDDRGNGVSNEDVKKANEPTVSMSMIVALNKDVLHMLSTASDYKKCLMGVMTALKGMMDGK